jgi:hypothetical protein
VIGRFGGAKHRKTWLMVDKWPDLVDISGPMWTIGAFSTRGE